jgi:hypothetical protein
MDVLKMIDELRARLWKQYGNTLTQPCTQDEIHMTYYAGEVLRQNGHEWFSVDGREGACYTEKAMHAAFLAGLRVGKREAVDMADRIVEDRMARAQIVLDSGHE